ncbi:aflatoxin biosynthesis regulatory protein [Aspergillus lentulus]|uniref:Aflatoxin biosynthesis regulatory protein n=1 Tax=Aspergillus lentulus TaxID=293939 RepID=A0AAN6BQU7_ASPLE|nr:aflatoxin biosynthesis regulatory protein [Aspergillus lentulus]KAF4155530.1 hypothetical protein CNMCM6069_007938 [Aspergillus lentulus]KAF4167385.1 hypothetical protein CNMCM6936_005342 [Aspergillus lentulus]KAF4206984.1 hypothetical protein CNMCM8927_004079 [Aspergillus lentulus]GFF39942.1 aflatoxin biosynthesis regulatory protein [Aspergillus lentulus]GFF58093.1 aflatoxin biosynthesis regulatory protein [Aspergillus lentulus]
MRSPASSRRASALHKLCDSCHACGLSKVRCSKEKPTCSRCRRRGTACEYVVTKRPGRKPDSRSGGEPKSVHLSHTLPSPESSTEISHGNFPDPDAFDPLFALPEPFDSTPELHSGPLSTVDSSLSSALTTWCPDFDDFFSFPVSTEDPFSGDCGAVYDGASKHPPNLRRRSESSPTVPNDTIYLFGKPVDPSPSDQSLPPTTTIGRRASPTSGKESQADFRRSSCRCLLRALDLLKQFEVIRRETDIETILPSIDGVVEVNKQTTDAITGILQCPCSQKDGYLLVLLALIVCKILDRYAAAAIPEKKQNRDPSCRLDESPVAGQRVLGELHCIQRVVNQLGPRLKSYGAQGASLGHLYHGTDAPLSVGVGDQLEPELHKRLSKLSSEIISHLREAQ